MYDISGITQFYFNMHFELHGRLGYNRRDVVREIEQELRVNEIEYDVMLIHCVLDELEEHNEITDNG